MTNQLAREAQRQQNAMLRAQVQLERARVKGAAEADRAAKLAHLGSRQQEVEFKNAEITASLKLLDSLLSRYVGQTFAIDFGELKRLLKIPPFDSQGLDKPITEPVLELPARPNMLANIIPALVRRNETAVQNAMRAHDLRLEQHAKEETARREHLVEVRQKYERDVAALVAETESFNRTIDDFCSDYKKGVRLATEHYFDLVLEKDQLPEGFPQDARVAYVSDSRQLVVERELPTVDIVPTTLSYRYTKSTDKIEQKLRPTSQIRALYASVVAQFTLSTASLIFNSDSAGVVDVLALSCFVNTISPATGKRIKPCLISLRLTRDTFFELDLGNVDPIACIRSLNARVSPSPLELKAVQPVVNFDMVDPRFVDKHDILSSLDQRPNLAELSPNDFESLMTNLFEKMGLETRLTRPSRDGGVDCVAWDKREILGGKVVIQAKRYRNTVGVSAVRDLFGTMINEGAAKGILVSTSGYGKAAYDFAQNKPLELITGENLLYLLSRYASVDAKIEFSEEWIDPSPDSADHDDEFQVFTDLGVVDKKAN